MNQVELSLFRKKVISATLVILATVVLLYAGFLARQPLLWIAIAGFLAVAINPIVQRTQRFMPKKSLALATVVVMLAFCSIIGVLIWLFLGPLLQQTVNLITSLPEIIAKINEALSKTPFQNSLTINKDAIIARLQTDGGQIISSVSQLGVIVLNVLSGVLGVIVAFVSVISLMFFMTLEGKEIKEYSLKLVGSEHRKQAAQIGSDVYGIINGYVVGNFIISAIYGVCSAVVLWLIGSPYFLILALVVGLIDLIPLVGATIGAALVAMIFLLSGQPVAALVFAVFTIVYVQFESAVLNPAIYSKNVDVSPLTVLASILIGGAVAGIMGALIAIPVAATLKVVINALLQNRTRAA